jgi:hypothetical protein
MTQDEFYENIQGWISKDKSSWNHITLIAYFCHKYELKNNTRFRLVKWNAHPGRGKESRDFAKLIELFLPEKYEQLDKEEQKRAKQDVIIKIYNYINWMFDYKFRSGEKSVTGTKLFLMPSMINEFERMYSSFIKKKSSENKIESFLSYVKENYSSIFDHHQIDDINDLKILKRYVDSYNLPENAIEYIIISKAKEMELI